MRGAERLSAAPACNRPGAPPGAATRQGRLSRARVDRCRRARAGQHRKFPCKESTWLGSESSINPRAVNRNANGSYDVGLIQINSSWFPQLKRHGIEERHLYDPCVSLQVGAWILAQNLRRLRDPWLAVGAYNSPTPARARAYALKVYRNLPPAPAPG